MSCSVVTSKGSLCKFKARNGGTLCTLHYNKKHGKKCLTLLSNGKTCKNNENIIGSGRCSRHEDTQCSQMVTDGESYIRCTNSKHGSNNVCITHLSANRPIESKKCCGYSYNGKEIVKCTLRPSGSSRGGLYCSDHKHKYRFGPEDCSICMSSIDYTLEIPLGCGHCSHKACLKQWGKPICPICRTPMTTAESQLYKKEIDLSPIRKLLTQYRTIFNSMERAISRLGEEDVVHVLNLHSLLIDNIGLLDAETITHVIAASSTIINPSFISVMNQLEQ